MHNHKREEFLKELECFQNIFSQVNKDDEVYQLGAYLKQLLALDTCDEVINYYSVTKKDNITLLNFEKKMNLFDNVDTLKSNLIVCFTDNLAEKYKEKTK